MDSYRGKHVLVTGDTGFVGTWLTAWLEKLGADVHGLSLPHDIGNASATRSLVRMARPDIVFHLAAQALIADSLFDPWWTFNTNVMGTVNVLEGVRSTESVKATVVVTSDKCYEPQIASHLETDRLGGDDPYSASKACAEHVAHAYQASYALNIATARAGNIIGGGDWSARLVPDCIRALQRGETLELRNPNAVRPFQHVLDAVWGYLLLGDALLNDDARGAWNFGPDHGMSVGQLASMFGVKWKRHSFPSEIFIETETLRLDSTKALQYLGWLPRLNSNEMVDWTLSHYWSVVSTDQQIDRYMERVA